MEMKALAEGWSETTSKDLTQTFLEKCRGWEDTRKPEKIVADSTQHGPHRTAIHKNKLLSSNNFLFNRDKPKYCIRLS